VKDVESELIKSNQEIYRLNHATNYFHGSIDRQTAEKLLRDAYIQIFGNLNKSLKLYFFKLNFLHAKVWIHLWLSY